MAKLSSQNRNLLVGILQIIIFRPLQNWFSHPSGFCSSKYNIWYEPSNLELTEK